MTVSISWVVFRKSETFLNQRLCKPNSMPTQNFNSWDLSSTPPFSPLIYLINKNITEWKIQWKMCGTKIWFHSMYGLVGIYTQRGVHRCPPRWVYMATTVELYTHHAGAICPPTGMLINLLLQQIYLQHICNTICNRFNQLLINALQRLCGSVADNSSFFNSMEVQVAMLNPHEISGEPRISCF